MRCPTAPTDASGRWAALAEVNADGPQSGAGQLCLFGTDSDGAAPRRGQSRRAGGQPRHRPDRPRVCVLGSGSGGNATVITHGGRAMLIDAGFGPATIDKRLTQAGLGTTPLTTICLTHLDRDHFRPGWPAAALARGVTVYLHHWHLPELAAMAGGPALLDAGLVEPIADEPVNPLPGVAASAVRVQHDMQGTLAYRLWDDRVAIGYATDLGHAPTKLIAHLSGVDLLCLEANYDPHLTRTSARPAFVNRRNMSTSGHLSNAQACRAAQQIADRSPIGRPERIVLLHRSRECNHPKTVRRAFAEAPDLADRVILTHQRRRSRWIHPSALSPMRRGQLRLTL